MSAFEQFVIWGFFVTFFWLVALTVHKSNRHTHPAGRWGGNYRVAYDPVKLSYVIECAGEDWNGHEYWRRLGTEKSDDADAPTFMTWNDAALWLDDYWRQRMNAAAARNVKRVAL